MDAHDQLLHLQLFGLPSSQITAELSKPNDLSAADLLADLRTGSPFSSNSSSFTASSVAARSASPMASLPEMNVISDDMTDYFSPRSTASPAEGSDSRGMQSRANATPTSASETEVREAEILAEDVALLARGSAARWRKVATTMPKALWKSAEESTTCDHMLLGRACNKPFGHFVGKYRLPDMATATLGASNLIGRTSSKSALWGSVKINRRNDCWRCGNCFCDDHGGIFATLLLDAEDSPQGPSRQGERESCSVSAARSEDLALTDVGVRRAPLPSAVSSLSQYLASHDAGATAKTAPGTSSGDGASVASSLESSNSDGWQSVSSGSNLAVSLRQHAVAQATPVRATVASDNNAANFPGQIAAAPSTLKEARQDTAPAKVGSSNSGPSNPVSDRMMQMADGRFAVRERVCARCSNIVEQAKARALHKQAMRELAQHDESKLLQERLQQQEEDEEHRRSMQRLYDDYRRERSRERRALLAAAKRGSFDSNLMTMASARDSNARVVKPRPPARRQTSVPFSHATREDDNDDDEEEDEDCYQQDFHTTRHCDTTGRHYRYPVFPSRADFEDQHQLCTPISAANRQGLPLAAYGMGGQRLQIALSKYT